MFLSAWPVSAWPVERENKIDIISLMGVVTQEIPLEFKKLSAEARIRHVQNLWDFIAEASDKVQVPKSHEQILDKRLAAYEADGNQAASWNTVRDNILKNLGSN